MARNKTSEAKMKPTKGEICVILQEFSDAREGQVNLDSRIAQEQIADKILENWDD